MEVRRASLAGMNTDVDPRAMMAAVPQRRSAVVQIGPVTYRVSEPPPIQGFRVLMAVVRMLGPVLTRMISGQVRLWAEPRCPSCGTEGTDQIRDTNGRWLCTAEVAPEGPQATEGAPRAGRRCGTVWDKSPLLDDQGRPQQATIGYIMADRQWRAALALQVERQLDNLSPDEMVDLMRSVLGGGLLERQTFPGQWIQVRDLDAQVANGMALVMLVQAAFQAWVLPTLVDDYRATSPDSSTNPSQGDQGGDSTATHGASEVQPGPPSGPTRVPPPVRRTR